MSCLHRDFYYFRQVCLSSSFSLLVPLLCAALHLRYSPLLTIGYFIGFSLLTHVGTGSSFMSLLNPKKNGHEYRSAPVLFTTLCTVDTKKSLVCRMKQSAIFTTMLPGIGLALIQYPDFDSTSSPACSSCVTKVKHSKSVWAPIPSWSDGEA